MQRIGYYINKQWEVYNGLCSRQLAIYRNRCYGGRQNRRHVAEQDGRLNLGVYEESFDGRESNEEKMNGNPKQFTSSEDYLQYLSELTDITPEGRDALLELLKILGDPMIEYFTHPQKMRDWMTERSGVEASFGAPQAIFFSGEETDPDTIRYSTGIEGGKWEKQFPYHLRNVMAESSHAILERYLGEMWMKGEQPSSEDINQIMSGKVQPSKTQDLMDTIEQSKSEEFGYGPYDDPTKVEGFSHKWIEPLLEMYFKQQFGIDF